VFSRPELYDILLSEIPKERIWFNKRVLSMTKTINGTEINCSDNSSYEADIIVGADGAYSSIRQNIYRTMSELGTLPASDSKDMAMPYLCMVGTTTPRDPEKYPELKDLHTHIHHVIGDSTPYSVRL
jgi:2-polyprenyl-6-methoxyphenol hydroxylase-like FAD-dependent oxidoreductase